MRNLAKLAVCGEPWAVKEFNRLVHNLPAALYTDVGVFRHNSESEKLIEMFLKKAEEYQNGKIDAFLPKPDTD